MCIKAKLCFILGLCLVLFFSYFLFGVARPGCGTGRGQRAPIPLSRAMSVREVLSPRLFPEASAPLHPPH